MQRLFTEQLEQNLNQQLADIYYLVGQDHLLLLESRDAIVKYAKEKGFDEKKEITIDNSTNWDDIFEQVQAQGLFFNRQVLVLRLPENISANLQKHLLALMGLLHEDILLVLLLTKLSKVNEKQKWIELSKANFKTILVNCQTPNIEQLPRWITNRARLMGLTLEPEALSVLCYSYENNLLALKQILQLLALLHPNKKITYSLVKEVVEQSSVFTVFQWVDALLVGNASRAERILKGLQSEDIQPIILLRTLQRELMTLLQLSQPTRIVKLKDPLPSKNLKLIFDRLKIWQNRRALFIQGMQRLNYIQLYKIIQHLADIERLAKQKFNGDIWQELIIISSNICHPHSLS